MPEELPLEPDLIKVLAADTRREILGQLQDRRMTVTELSEELELGKATVHEHLNKLTEAGLVQRDEDDRLWVYYELTGRGKRLLNPQRTRFYLALASAVVAALVAGLAVYGFMMTGGVGTVDETAASQQLVTPTTDEVYADEAIEVPARLSGDGDVQAYLVDERSAEEIREGNLDVQGLPMRAYAPSSAEAGDVQARDDTTLLRGDASLEPGTYYLYVRGSEGDNAETMPSLRLRGIDAEPGREVWHQRLDEGALEIQVDSEGDPLAGSLRLEAPDRGASPIVPLHDGVAVFEPGTLDALEPGSYRVSVQPDDRERWLTTSTRITVQPGQIAVHPLHVPEGTPTPVHVHVAGPDRLVDRQPTLSPAHPVHATDDGWRIDLQPEDREPVRIQVARTAATVSVHPSLAVEATVHDGPEVNWTLTRPDGAPAAQAAVYLDGRALGFADANGTLVTDLPDEGPHRLTVHRADGATIARLLTVDGWRISQPDPSLGVEPVDVASTPVSARITLEVTNDAALAQPATIVAELAGTPAATTATTVPAEGTVSTELTVPADLGRQQVTVRAQPLDPGAFTYANETTQEDETDANTTDDSTDDSAEMDSTGATTDESSGGSSTATVGSSAHDGTADSDGDGITDADDDCPSMPGSADNNGCPAEAAASKLEPIRGVEETAGSLDGEEAADGEASEGAETPAAGPFLAVATVALAALLARVRKP